MRKSIYFFSIFILSNILFGQKLEIKYQEILKVDNENFKNSITSEGAGTVNNDIKEQILKSLTEPKDFLLRIIDQESTYAQQEKINNDQNSNMKISVSFSGGGNNLYKDISKDFYLKDAQIFDKKYTIKDQLKDYKWQLTRETKSILGLEVKKAISTIDSTKTVVAWYTPEIKIKNGPSEYGGLPGLILEVEQTLKNSKTIASQIFRAVDIQETPEMKALVKPIDKKTINANDFNELVEKQNEKYKSMMGQGVDKKD